MIRTNTWRANIVRIWRLFSCKAATANDANVNMHASNTSKLSQLEAEDGQFGEAIKANFYK